MLKGLIGWLSMLSFAMIAVGALLLSVWNVKDDLKDLINKKGDQKPNIEHMPLYIE